MQKSIRFSDEAIRLINEVADIGDFGCSATSVVENCVKSSLKFMYVVEVAIDYEHGEVSSQWNILPFQMMILLETELALRDKRNKIVGEFIQKGYELQEILNGLDKTVKNIRPVKILSKTAYNHDTIDNFVTSNFLEVLEMFKAAEDTYDSFDLSEV